MRQSLELAGQRWRFHRAGAGPGLLLLHGTGASGDSWRELIPVLSERFEVVAPDLPGHGGGPVPPAERMRLPAMAAALAGLMDALGIVPRGIAGHSAGAAVAARMALDAPATVRRLAFVNAALMPFDGLPGMLFGPMARWLARRRVLPAIVARQARDRRAVERLVDNTGSRLGPEGLAVYHRLVRDPDHVAGALAMMANWDLAPLQRQLPTLRAPVLLLAGSADRTVPPWQSGTLAARWAQAKLEWLPGLGHLAHEERPLAIAQRLRDWFAGDDADRVAGPPDGTDAEGRPLVPDGTGDDAQSRPPGAVSPA